MKIHSNDWEMILNNAHDPSAEYILIPIIHYEIALFPHPLLSSSSGSRGGLGGPWPPKFLPHNYLLVTRCAYAQGRVKRLSPSICLSSKNTAVCCLTARKSPRNSSLPLGLAIYILRKMPRKPDESSVECYGHGFLIAARPRGV